MKTQPGPRSLSFVCLSSKQCEEHSLTTLVVCARDADLVLQSCDNVLFKVHRQQLGGHSTAFAGQVDAEIIHLPEPAAVLELLLQYMHIQDEPPDLTAVEFKDLEGLAEAAHKYKVPFAVYESKKGLQGVVL